VNHNLFLQDVLDTSAIIHGKFNLIVAPCGCGKTTAAINKLAAMASSPRKALFLIDTHNGNERLARLDALTMPYVFFELCAKNARFPSTEVEHNKIVITTYAQFGVWVQNDPGFAANFEVIICDEAHNIVVFPTYSPQPNYASMARDALCRAAQSGKTLVVGMTATPKPLKNLNCPINCIPIDTSVLRQYENRHIIKYSSLRQILEGLPLDTRGALYVPHIHMMKEYEEIAIAAGRKPICIWSASNKDFPMNEEQHAARQYILEHEEVPPQYDLFIFNASCETSINIRGHMDFFIVHTASATSITQARGRYRGDLETLYCFDRTADNALTVPEEFLDIQLFPEDQRQLRLRLSIKNGKGHYLKYAEQYHRIETSGYSIDYGRENNRRYIIIRKLE